MSNAMRDSRVCVPAAPAAARASPAPARRARLRHGRAAHPAVRRTGDRARPYCSPTRVRRGGAGVAWLTPTAADAEPRRFWRLLESALRDGNGVESGPLAGAPRAVSVDLVQALFRRVPEPEARLVVVIDDAHLLTRATCWRALGQPDPRSAARAEADPGRPQRSPAAAAPVPTGRADARAAGRELAMTQAEIAEVLSAHGAPSQPGISASWPRGPRDGRRAYSCPPCGWRAPSTLPISCVPNWRWIRAASVSTW